MSKLTLWSNCRVVVATFVATTFIAMVWMPKPLIAQNLPLTSRSIQLLYVGAQDASPRDGFRLKIVQGYPERSAGQQIEVPPQVFTEMCQVLLDAPLGLKSRIVFEALPTGCPSLLMITKSIGPDTFLHLMSLARQPNAAGKYFPSEATYLENMVRNNY